MHEAGALGLLLLLREREAEQRVDLARAERVDVI